jgi:membrane associated rhomboid family serine protease
VLTLAVAAATLAMALVQACVPGTLRDLGRTPAGRHGDWWRSLTALVVQDGGVAGTVFNLIGLLAVGTVAEQSLERRHWLAQYFAVGLASEFVGYAWQPVGGGNSVAVCGLSGGVALALWHRDPRLPGYAGPVIALWSAGLLATIGTYGLIPAAVLGAATVNLSRVLGARGVDLRRPFAAAVAMAGIVLCAWQNIHGPALLFGVVLAVALARGRRREPRHLAL